LLPNLSIDELKRIAVKMPPLPQIAQKALFLIRDPDSNMAEISKVISMDQVMTSQILRWANSAYYSLLVPITTIHQAVMYLGQNTIQSLILTASISTYFDRSLPGYGLDRGELWKHSVSVAATARIIATRLGRTEAEEAYHAGLLCDIGKLVFDLALRNINFPAAQIHDLSFDEIEQTFFGIDHASMGAIIAKNWKLPPLLETAIGFHHKPGKCTEFRSITAAVHIADVMVTMLGVGVGRDGLLYRIDPEALVTLGYKEQDVDSLFARTATVIKETEEFIRRI
jgi:putative nucleotidyltransferase with HDIG domain